MKLQSPIRKHLQEYQDYQDTVKELEVKIKEITEDIEKYNHECKIYWEIIEILLKKTNQTSSDMQQ